MKIALALLVSCALLLGLAGCKSKEEKVCAHMKTFVDDGNYSDGECMKDLNNIKEKCANADEVLDCLLTKDKEEQLRECESKCTKK